MKFSICIPQYNRIDFLLRNLEIIRQQTYPDIEIVISDDQSSDDTVKRINELTNHYPFPIVLHINERNLGYDFNFRKSISLANGEYCLVLGNDDTMFHPEAIQTIVDFLKTNQFPDIGYVNYVEDNDHEIIIERAQVTQLYGSGIPVALRFYNGFSFVPGIIFKKSSFEKFNTDQYDGSIYTQMYIATKMIVSGCRFFAIAEPLVIKDINDVNGNAVTESYKNNLMKTKGEFKVQDGGLPAVGQVLISAIRDAMGRKDSGLAYRILRRIYSVNFPYWIIEYKKYGGYLTSLGLVIGMFPPLTVNWPELNYWGRFRLFVVYLCASLAGLLTPSKWFKKMEVTLRKMARRAA